MSPQFGLFSALLLATGFIYAAYIYHKPPKEGWTWVSVVIGDGFTDIGMSALIATVLLSNGLWDSLWWMIFIPEYCHLLTGVPMIIGQVKFKRDQDRRIEEIVSNGK